MHVCVQIFFEITEPTEDKVYVGPPQDRGENLFKCFRSVVVLYTSLTMKPLAALCMSDKVTS